MIYTSYFANLKNIPEGYVPVSICGKAPEGYTGLQFKKLAPSYDIFSQYKETGDRAQYSERYIREILGNLDPHKIINELYTLSNTQNVVLVCYEGKGKFCHRHLVAGWLQKAGYMVGEYDG